ncbi:peptidase S8 and S53 subtilisin kexin sedolisin [Halobiforma nitratireducens JCM 10879]|uniref:Peptidase S8 and S53 subtilisin kexin sedolisin n=2 Tax=Halobiforma nitratireducens TaxID=130048 RepID=M0LWG8_9EURY|nr:peptidase S8 and S53 subtilisin kexin sedolisin [Halobiforma nitratireducens JCM 10879]
MAAGPATSGGTAHSVDEVNVDEVTTQTADDVEIQSELADDASEQDRLEVIVNMDSSESLYAETLSEDSVEATMHEAETTQAPLKAYAEDTDGVTVEDDFWATNAVLLEVDTTEVSLEQIASVDGVIGLYENAEIQIPEPNAEGDADDVDAETFVGGGEDPTTTFGLDQIDAPEAWDITTGEGVDVAVADTGIDPDHPDIDLDEDNWVNYVDSEQEPHDDHGHGTHVAGTIAGGDASGANIGVAPDATLHGVKILGADGGGSLAGILASVDYAIANDIDVINYSIGVGSGTFADFAEEIYTAYNDHDVVVVGSAGNSGHGIATTPGDNPGSITVGATDDTEDVVDFSSGDYIHTETYWGEEAPEEWPDEYVAPDVSAPGHLVASAAAEGAYEDAQVHDDPRLASISGTSMAAPHVAGTAALVQSSTEEDLGAEDIHETIDDTAQNPVDSEDEDVRHGNGIVNAYEAVTEEVGTTTVEGEIVDPHTGNGVPGAVVEASGSETLTDVDGEFEFEVNEKIDELTVTADGYESTTAAVDHSDSEYDVGTLDLYATPAFDLEMPADEIYALGVPGPTDQTLDDVFDETPEGVVYEFDTDDNSWELISDFDQEVDPLDAYAVVAESDASATVEFTGEPGSSATGVPAEGSVDDGWNFVSGPAADSPEDAFEASTADPVQIFSMQEGPEGALVTEESAIGGAPASIEGHSGELNPFKGYFVYAADDGSVGTQVTTDTTFAEASEMLGYDVGTIEGTVERPSGAGSETGDAVEGATVYSDTGFSATTAEDGSFTIPYALEGESIELHADAEGYELQETEAIEASGGDSGEEITLHAEAIPSVEITNVDASETSPITEGEEFEFTYEVSNEGDLDFEGGVVEKATERNAVNYTDSEPLVPDDDEEHETTMGTDIGDAGIVPITVEAGAELDEGLTTDNQIDGQEARDTAGAYVEAAETGSIYGDITDTAGDGIDDVTVTAEGDTAGPYEVETDATGSYEIEDVVADDVYSVEADHDYYTADDETGVEVDAEQGTSVNFELAENGELTGTVTALLHCRRRDRSRGRRRAGH